MILSLILLLGYSASVEGAYPPPSVTSVEILANGTENQGQTLLRVGYDFPETGPFDCRRIKIEVPGVGANGGTTERVGYGDPETTGSANLFFHLWCPYFPKGNYTITVTPITGCSIPGTPPDVVGSPETINLPLDSPKVLSVSPDIDSTGQGTVTVAADFSHTRGSVDRYIEVWFNNAQLYGTSWQGPIVGSQTFPLNAGCLPAGSYPLKIVARRFCQENPRTPEWIDESTTTFTTPQAKGTVEVQYEESPIDSERRVFGTYTLPPNTSSAQLLVEELATFDEGGTLVPVRQLIPLTTVTQPAGVFEFKPFTASTGALQAKVKATLSACSWQADASASVPCGECPYPPTATPNPVSFSDANMRYSESDPLPRQLDAVALDRTYDTHHRFRSFFGRGWWSFFDARLVVHNASGGDTIAMTTETNESATFLRRGGVYTQLWPAGQPVPDTLSFDSASAVYVLRRAGSSVASLYRTSDGRFAGLRQIGTGREMRVEWNAQGMPVSVTDSWTALTWTVTTDATKRRITEITIGDLVWQYEYDANDNLQRVVAPQNATWRTYSYVNDLMTAAYDASGNLIESHNYNAVGAAIDSTGPDDEIENIQYLAGTAPNEKIARLTMKTGAIAEYTLQPIGSAYRTVRVTGGCSSCGARDSSYAYDAAGHLAREQDASGYITVHTYAAGRQTAVEEHLRPQGCDPATDPNRCRLEPAPLATATLEATTATLRTDYEYADPIWPDKPTSVTTTSVLVPGGSRVATTVYHPLSGQVLRTNVSGWTGEAAKTDRGSSTTFYGDPPPDDDGDSVPYDPYAPAFDPGGSFQSEWLALPQPPLLPKFVDGPRNDVADITLFVYYPVSETVLSSELRGRLAAVKNAAGHVTRYESYDLFGNVTRVVDPNGVATEMEYDILGRIRTTTLEGVAGCDTAKDPLCATDLASTRIYSPPAGLLESETRPGGGITKYTYDARGRVRTLSRGPSATDLREQIESTYDAATAKKSLERILAFEGGTWVEKTRESFSYDTLGQLQTVTHADVEGQSSTSSYEYDAEGRVSKVRDENHTTPNTCYEYDPAGRIAKVAQTLGTAPCGGITTRFGYDVHGNMTSVTDPNGNVTTYVNDDFGSLILQQSPATGTTLYDYDDAGNLTDTTDARGARTARFHDATSRVVSTVSSLDGVTETVLWSYDDATQGRFGIGRLARMTDPAGTTEYDYERRGMLIEERRAFMAQSPAPPPGGDDGRDETGQPPPPPSGPGDGDGRLGTLSDDDRVPAPGPLHEATTKFTYDRDGNRTSIAYPSTHLTVNYTFDFAGRPLTASGAVMSASYLPFGPLKELKFANNTTQTMDYDERYRMQTNELRISGTIGNAGRIARYTYGYDAASNITSINDTMDSSYNRHSFQYDDLHRLTKANTNSSLWVKGDYQWDAMGNIVRTQLTEVIPDDGTEALAAGNPKKFKPTNRPKSKKDLQRAGIQPLGRAVSFAYTGTTPVISNVTLNDLSRTVQHDVAGNETAYAITRSYSPRNLLASVSDSFNAEDPALLHAIAYGYDGRGVRVSRRESPSNGPDTSARRYYVYTPELQLLSATRDDAENIWEPEAFPQPSFANNVHYEIIWFGGRPVAQFSPGSFTRFTFTDHLGTPLLQTDTAAEIAWRVEYEPFGSVYEVRNGLRTDQPLRFPGQELAMTWEGPEENANVFRWYKTSWGRYTQADPMGAVRRRGSQLEANHLYGYVDGNPLRFIDPLGLVKWNCGFYIATANVPIGPGGGGMLAACKSECKNKKSVFVQLASGVVGLSAGPLPAGLSVFNSTLEDDTDTPDAQNLVGAVVYGSVGGWLGLGGGCSNIHLGKAKGKFGCSFTWFGGIDVGLDVYFGYSAIVDGPYESCCK